jgi:hypothetical protein
MWRRWLRLSCGAGVRAAEQALFSYYGNWPKIEKYGTNDMADFPLPISELLCYNGAHSAASSDKL